MWNPSRVMLPCSLSLGDREFEPVPVLSTGALSPGMTMARMVRAFDVKRTFSDPPAV